MTSSLLELQQLCQKYQGINGSAVLSLYSNNLHLSQGYLCACAVLFPKLQNLFHSSRRERRLCVLTSFDWRCIHHWLWCNRFWLVSHIPLFTCSSFLFFSWHCLLSGESVASALNQSEEWIGKDISLAGSHMHPQEYVKIWSEVKGSVFLNISSLHHLNLIYLTSLVSPLCYCRQTSKI